MPSCCLALWAFIFLLKEAEVKCAHGSCGFKYLHWQTYIVPPPLTAFLFQENGLTFSLEAVKRLQELAGSSSMAGQQNPRLRASPMSLCADPMLPQEFLSLCRQRSASSSFTRLGETVASSYAEHRHVDNRERVLEQCVSIF